MCDSVVQNKGELNSERKGEGESSGDREGGGSGTSMTDFRISNTCFDTSKMIKLSILNTPFNIYSKLKMHRAKKHQNTQSMFFPKLEDSWTLFESSLFLLFPLTLSSKFSKDHCGGWGC